MLKTEQIRRLSRIPDLRTFGQSLQGSNLYPLRASGIDIFQMNAGKRCNLSCRHCHVQAGPNRPETMERPVFEKCLAVIQESSCSTVDITGGSPEMNQNLEWFLGRLAPLKRRVIVRSNLVILLEPAFCRFMDIYAAHGVEVVGSLPFYEDEKSDRQRGAKSFRKSIRAIRGLNERGYGREDSGLVLDLVHNPVGAYLPGPQAVIEAAYRSRLARDHGVVFNRLFCLTNCPVGRYLEYLTQSGNFKDYMAELASAYNAAAARQVMCRTTISIGWDGTLYDCDFNQMLGLSVNHGAPDHIDRFDFNRLNSREIVINNHCYACTAGSGSSCQGATDK
jgi:radical SAM/Cys-rich protein